MFFLVLTSQSLGSPFAFDTMFRSGEPPHIGQSPVPGSEAKRRAVETVAITARATLMQSRKDAKNASAPLRRVFVMLFIGCQLQVVDVRPELGIDEETRRTLAIPNRIGLVDLPRRGLGLPGGPCLAARAHLAIGQILDAQLDRVPRVGLPLERHD